LALGIRNGWMKGLHSSLKRNSFLPLILPLGALVYTVCERAQHPEAHLLGAIAWNVFCSFFIAFIAGWILLFTKYRVAHQTWWLVGLFPIQLLFAAGCAFVGAMPITGIWL
jgi:hypothetical protein